MREKTLRWCCRAGFMLLCVAPTLATMILAVVRHTPALVAARKSAYETDLSQRLGLAVAFDRLTFPRLGATLLEGVQLSDPETGARIARVRLVEIAETDGGVVILASQPELQGGQLELVWRVLHERILRAPSDTRLPAELIAREATVHGQRYSQTVRDLRCLVQPGPTGQRVSCDFRLVGAETGEPVRFRVFRNRQASPPSTRWELHTGATPLPCAALASYVKAFGCLGEQCRFEGSAWATQAGDGWNGDVSGRFSDVDLDRLVTDRFPHKLSGVAEIEISRARFLRGRLTSAAGSFICDGGVISRSMLTAAVESLHLTSSEAIHESNEPLWRYRRLAFGFAMDDDGVSITGLCESTAPGAILTDSQGVLLADPPERVIPTLALVRTLAPQSEIQVPASAETDSLLRALPLPSVIAPRASTARAPYSPLRLR